MGLYAERGLNIGKTVFVDIRRDTGKAEVDWVPGL